MRLGEVTKQQGALILVRDQSKTYVSIGESVPLLLWGGITSDVYKHLQAGVHQEHVLQSQEID